MTEEYDENEKYGNKFNYIKNKTINNINNYPSLTPVIKNDYNRNNNYESQRNSNQDESNIQINNMQNYFKFNANTPNRFNATSYEYLINKKRPKTPKTNEIPLVRKMCPPKKKVYVILFTEL